MKQRNRLSFALVNVILAQRRDDKSKTDGYKALRHQNQLCKMEIEWNKPSIEGRLLLKNGPAAQLTESYGDQACL